MMPRKDPCTVWELIGAGLGWLIVALALGGSLLLH
jgi:hypothetical protein